MSSAQATVDLDDTDGLLDADRDGLLRSAALAGAQVRAVASAVEEGALESVIGDHRPRTVIWLAGRGPAQTAGAMLSAALGGVAGEPLVAASEALPWIGPLDVLVVAGDDPGDPTLVAAAATAVRRGARVVVAAPYEGPLRDATAGRSAVLAPRLWVHEEFGLSRYLAAGLAVLAAVDAGLSTDLNALADELDAEALRNGVSREVFTNPAKALAERMTGRPVVLAGDCPATVALARHAAAVLLRMAGRPVGAVGLADAVVAVRVAAAAGFADPVFHDEEIDGPLPSRPRVLALTLDAERTVLSARIAGIDGVDLVGVEDVGEAGSVPAGNARAEQQLATLAVRLEMAAVYLRLAGG
ncbi:MAG: TobH protein [Mycobacterium sp.]|nr:TobH protein [Mycobacterium sp.]